MKRNITRIVNFTDSVVFAFLIYSTFQRKRAFVSANAVKLYFFGNRRLALAKGFCNIRLMRTILNAFGNDSTLFKSEMTVFVI